MSHREKRHIVLLLLILAFSNLTAQFNNINFNLGISQYDMVTNALVYSNEREWYSAKVDALSSLGIGTEYRIKNNKSVRFSMAYRGNRQNMSGRITENPITEIKELPFGEIDTITYDFDIRVERSTYISLGLSYEHYFSQDLKGISLSGGINVLKAFSHNRSSQILSGDGFLYSQTEISDKPEQLNSYVLLIPLKLNYSFLTGRLRWQLSYIANVKASNFVNNRTLNNPRVLNGAEISVAYILDKKKDNEGINALE